LCRVGLPPGAGPEGCESSVSQALRLAVGVDIGATKLLAVVVDRSGVVHGEVILPTPSSRGDVVKAAVGATVRLFSQVCHGATLDGVGFGLPGLVDRNGHFHLSSNLHGLDFTSISELAGPLLDQLVGASRPSTRGPRVVCENDATCAAVAEHLYGAARGVASSFTVTLGTGIGGGAVIDGRVLRGEHNFAGEVGHMVIDPTGPVCGCGRRGCWERFASGTGVAMLAQNLARGGKAEALLQLAGGDADHVTAEHVAAALRGGDEAAAVVADKFGRYFATGLANLVLAFDPAVIVVGGGLAHAVPELLEKGFAAYECELLPERRALGPRLAAAQLGGRAGAIGAGALALGELT
jgi:glucokinase